MTKSYFCDLLRRSKMDFENSVPATLTAEIKPPFLI
jgi:hypothetical protein